MTRSFVLYAHILAATLLVGGTTAARIARRGVLAAPDLSSLRGALDVVRRIAQANPVLALILLGSGLWLGGAGFWQMPWFWVAVATWTANLAMAVALVAPAGQRLGAAAATAGDGPVPERIDALRRAPAPSIAHDAMIGLDLGTLAMMVARPALVEAVLWPLLGTALMMIVRLADGALAERRGVAGEAA